MTITLDQARTLIAGARAAARERGFKPLTVVVLDAGGHVVAAEREDGSSNKRFEIAYGKAHGAISMGLGSRALMARNTYGAMMDGTKPSRVSGKAKVACADAIGRLARMVLRRFHAQAPRFFSPGRAATSPRSASGSSPCPPRSRPAPPLRAGPGRDR